MDTTPTGVSQQPIASTPFSGTPTDNDFQSLWERMETPPPAQPAREVDPAANAQPDVQARANDGRFAKTGTEVATPEAEAKTDVPAAQDEPEEAEEFDSLDDFLAKNKLDADAFLKLPTTVKVDGETRRETLANVIKSFQLEGHVNNKSIQLSEQQKAFEAERQTAQTLYRQQLTQAQTLATYAHQQLLGEYGAINWDQLKATDPITWAIKSQEFQARNAQIHGHLAQVTQAQEAETKKAQEAFQATLPKELERMLDANPDWRDEGKLKSAREAMRTYGKTRGLTDAEMNAISDHRFMLILNDAAQWRSLQAKAPEAAKKVRAAPIMAKPGARTQQGDPKLAARKQAIEAFNKNPRSLDAQAAAFEALLGE